MIKANDCITVPTNILAWTSQDLRQHFSKGEFLLLGESLDGERFDNSGHPLLFILKKVQQLDAPAQCTEILIEKLHDLTHFQAYALSTWFN